MCFGFGFGLACVGWGWVCVVCVVCDDMVGAGWAGKGGTGWWIEGLLDFVVWSGMHECSCSTVLLIAFSSWPPLPPPPSRPPFPFAVVVQYTSIRSAFSPINLTSQTQTPLSTAFPIPAHPSGAPLPQFPISQPRAKTHPTSSPPLPIPHQTIYALPSFFKKKRAISRSHDLSRGRSAA